MLLINKTARAALGNPSGFPTAPRRPRYFLTAVPSEVCCCRTPTSWGQAPPSDPLRGPWESAHAHIFLTELLINAPKRAPRDTRCRCSCPVATCSRCGVLL
jgi:hypothetical protein